MGKNIIFCYTGTGNCLKLARDIAARIGDCAIVPVGGDTGWPVAGGADETRFERVGFVFPVYFGGLPGALDAMPARLDGQRFAGAYTFAVATYGNLEGNALAQLARRLHRHCGVQLDYAARLRMFSNYVTLYDMKEDVAGIAARAEQGAAPIIEAIAAREGRKPPIYIAPIGRFNRSQVTASRTADAGFHTNENCTSCGICRDVCPIGNIALEEGRPVWLHRCERCLACIHYCTTRAIDFKDKTQRRRRYHNPEVDCKAMAAFRRTGERQG
jgi:ferredoxin